MIPCLNEAETIGACIAKALEGIRQSGETGEVIVADNGSTDASIEIAQSLGARVVRVSKKGYGNALRGGIAGSGGDFIVMADADDSYDFREIPRFVEKLSDGHDLVMGCRFPSRGGKIMPGAMPWKNRWIGNPSLSFLGRLFFRSKVRDFHCGLRAFSREAYDGMNVQTTGMEFASEIVIKATLGGLSIAEVPVTLHKDGRSRPPHLRPWRDGWRHLRFMLLYSPRWLFLVPGLLLAGSGAIFSTIIAVDGLRIGNAQLDVGSLAVSCMGILVGFQLVAFAFYAKVYAISEGLLPNDKRLDSFMRFLTLERGIVLSLAVAAAGLGLLLHAAFVWWQADFGPLPWHENLRRIIPAITMILLGGQAVFACFFLSILGLKTIKNDQ